MKTIFITSIFLLVNFYLPAQIPAQKADKNLLVNAMSGESHKHRYSLKGVSNETDFLFTSLFIFYKLFISSQDGNSCTFSPSCSEYMIQSIREKGIFIGALSGFDRLTRCNGLSPEKYSYDQEKKLFIDPVR